MKNVLLLFGGGGAEHEVSRVSSRFLIEQLSALNAGYGKTTLLQKFNLLVVEILEPKRWLLETGDNTIKQECHLSHTGELVFADEKRDKIKIDYAIPYMHGSPGETGEIQIFLSLCGVPFFGCDYEASMLCFNKIQTKLLLESRKIPIVPFDFIADISKDSMQIAEKLFDDYQGLFIKSSHQGSSVGCHLVKDKGQLKSAIEDSLSYSPYALLEKPIKAREIELSAYYLDGELKISLPGEVVCHGEFYDYEEKYSESSSAETIVEAELEPKVKEQIMEYAKAAAKLFRIKDLARIDFFLEGENIYLNELNTFPGLTPISMFPKMLEHNGHKFTQLLASGMKNILKH